MVLPYVRAITLMSDRGLYRSWLKDGIITSQMKRMRQVCRRFVRASLGATDRPTFIGTINCLPIKFARTLV